MKKLKTVCFDSWEELVEEAMRLEKLGYICEVRGRDDISCNRLTISSEYRNAIKDADVIKEKIESAKTSDFLTEGLEEAEVKTIVQDSVITTKELEEVIHRINVINRPYIALVNLVDKEKLLSAAPELEEKYVFYESYTITPGKVYLLDREKMEVPSLADNSLYDLDRIER